MKPRKPIPRRVPLPRSTTGIARTAVKRVNTKRKAHRFAQNYESQARVRWVKTRPCVVPFCYDGPCVNGHVRVAGAGLKGPSHEIAPFCRRHDDEYTNYGPEWFAEAYGMTRDLLLQAAWAVEIEWRASGGEYDA